MQIIDIEQGSDEWLRLHRHRLTSSRFKTILHGGERAWASLAREMRAQHATRSLDDIESIAWGHTNEPIARDEYTRVTGCVVRQIGFIIGDDERFGVSPDGLVGRHGFVEIKCPWNSDIHAQTVKMQRMPKEHAPQVYGIMLVAKRAWCDFVSFDPREENPRRRVVIVRVERDERYIARLRERCAVFLDAYTARKDVACTRANVVPKLF